MALTRAQAEGLLVPRAKKLLDAAGMDQSTLGGNPDLNSALADTLLRFGLTPADPAVVTDADLAALAADPVTVRAFLDWAELRMKRDILAALEVLVTQSAQTSYANLSDIAKVLQKDIQQLQDRLLAQYGGGLDRPTVRPIRRPWGRGPHAPSGWGGWW